MARVIWTDPALQDLDTIADYIALDKPVAATKLVRAVFTKVSNQPVSQIVASPDPGSSQQL
jgi:toxin ParE1/3/4